MSNLKNHKKSNQFHYSTNFTSHHKKTNYSQKRTTQYENMELNGCSLEEAENILGKHAQPVNPFINKYEIILEKYLFGLFFKRLHITTNMSGEITDYYARIDLR